MEFIYLVFTRSRMPGESYGRGVIRSLLLCSCDVFRELISSLFYCISVNLCIMNLSVLRIYFFFFFFLTYNIDCDLPHVVTDVSFFQ